MCGIAGIIGRAEERNRAALRRMSAAMSHRGPDGEGLWESAADEAGNACMLAHRRLSILDLSTAAAQPMSDPHGGQTIVFNGELYNFREIRDSLAAQGEAFHSTGDTEVLLRVLALRGMDALMSLRGMFAFGLWDPTKRQLMLARDPLGIKPLYISINDDPAAGWSLLFASEVRAILASGLIHKPRLDPAAVASVVWEGFVMGPATAVAQIQQIMPGEARIYDAAGKETRRRHFWQMPACNGKPATESDVARALEESVRLHLVSDVPLGVFLSGGIDSASVANLAQRASDRPVNTFTLAFEDESINEGPFARRIAEAIGSQHREILLTEQQFVNSLESALESLDQPTFDGLNSYFMSQAVREAGLGVALVGTGGDELFGGYKSFRDLPRLQKFARQSALVPRSLKVGAARTLVSLRKSGTVAPQTRWAKLPDMLERGNDLIGLYQLAYALFLPNFQRQLLSSVIEHDQIREGLPVEMRHRLTEETRGRSALSAISVLEQRCFLGERLLRDSDAASMAVSLELRLPLVDSVLVERVNQLADNVRYEPLGRKMVLRRAGLKGLDPALFDRPKSGFVLPFDRWIRAALGRAMDQTMRDDRAAGAVGLNGEAVARLWQATQDGSPGMYWSRAWAIYVLIRWCHRHNVLL